MSDECLQTLPKGAKIHASLRLVTWQPHGLLDAALAGEILRFMEEQEERASGPFNRFADLFGLDSVRLNFAEVTEIAARRIDKYQGQPVKSAIYAINPLAYGLGRMYQQLMRRSPIEVRVFSRLGSAANWLEVPVEVLIGAR